MKEISPLDLKCHVLPLEPSVVTLDMWKKQKHWWISSGIKYGSFLHKIFSQFISARHSLPSFASKPLPPHLTPPPYLPAPVSSLNRLSCFSYMYLCSWRCQYSMSATEHCWRALRSFVLRILQFLKLDRVYHHWNYWGTVGLYLQNIEFHLLLKQVSTCMFDWYLMCVLKAIFIWNAHACSRHYKKKTSQAHLWNFMQPPQKRSQKLHESILKRPTKIIMRYKIRISRINQPLNLLCTGS